MSAGRRKKSMTKYKKTELKFIFGGLIAVLIVTLVLGFSIIGNKKAKKVEPTTDNTSSQQVEDKTTEPESETEENTTEEPTTEENTTEEQTTEEGTTVDADSSPFNPTVITIDEENWEMTLLNTKYKLPDGYVPELAPAISGSGEMLDKRVQPHYEEMYNAALAEDIHLTPCSGYRSFAKQTDLHTRKVKYYKDQGYSNYDAEKAATRWSMIPGCSEHNFGVAMDIGFVEDSFRNTEAYSWLTEHAADYGFIERYKGDKEQFTGVAAEPWHWRYVGVENAKAINESGLCLEEYLGKTD